MIKFFRHIRKQLLGEGKTAKYFKYAIGEIVLVVIGILIALQINNWNEKRIHNNSARIYIENIREELKFQIADLNEVFINRFERKINGLKSAKSYYENPTPINDTLSFLNEISYGAVVSFGIEPSNQGVFESMINTGIIGNVEKELRTQIQNHYSNSRLVSQLSQGQASGYQDLVNGLRPFYPEAPKQMSKIDQNRFMEALETEEFIKEVNIEISNGLHNLQRINGVINSANKLINSIDNYLNND